MRVLHVAAYFAPAFRYGGPARSVFSLCRHLQAQGIDVEVLTTTADGPTDLPASPPEGDVYDGVPVRYLRRGFPRRFFGAVGLRQALHAALDRCDLVHLHGFWNVPVSAAGAAARRRGVPYVVSPRGMLQPEALARARLRKRIAYRLFDRRTLAAADLLHATSAEEAATLKGLVPDARVVTCPNGVDLPEPSPPGLFRRTAGVPADAPLIVFLGRIHPVKRLDILVDAFTRLAPRFPTARLVVAGPDECGLIPALRARAGDAADRILWTGHLGDPEKSQLLADANAAVLCSDTESFGLAIAEAMVAGVPAVVTKTCPWREVEQHGAGFWVDQNAVAVANALAALLADPSRARAMGERGRELIRTCYAWEPIAEAMAGHYRETLAAHHASPRADRQRVGAP